MFCRQSSLLQFQSSAATAKCHPNQLTICATRSNHSIPHKHRSGEHPGDEQAHEHLPALLDPCREASLKCPAALDVTMLGPHRRDQAHSGHAGDPTVMISLLDYADGRGRAAHCSLLAESVARL